MLETFRKNAVDAFERNSQEISGDVIKPIKFPKNKKLVRINAHGELINITHLLNIAGLAVFNPEHTVAVFTKRKDIVAQFMRLFGKPDNMIFVFSNPLLDQPILDVPDGFDKVFNVITSGDVNCGGQKCIECRKCYTHGGENVLMEMLK